MDTQQKTIAQRCLDGAYENTMSFPEGVQALMQAGFEGYHVDYRLNTRTYYLPNGETLVLQNPHEPGAVGAEFNQPEIAAAIQWAQRNPPDYSYRAFNDRVTANGIPDTLSAEPVRQARVLARLLRAPERSVLERT